MDDNDLFLRDLWQPSEKDSFFDYWDAEGAKARKKVMRHIMEMMSSAPCPKDSDDSSNLYKILVKKLRGQIGHFDSNPVVVDTATKKVAKWVENVVKEAYYRKQGRIGPKPPASNLQKTKEKESYAPVFRESEESEPIIEKLSIRPRRMEQEKVRKVVRSRSRASSTETDKTLQRSRRIEKETERIRSESRSSSTETDRGSVRSRRTEYEKIPKRTRSRSRTPSTDTDKAPLRSRRTEHEKIPKRTRSRSRTPSTETDKASLRSRRTEQEKASLRSGSPTKSKVPKSVIIDGVEYVLKKEESKEEIKEPQEQNIDIKIHKELKKAAVKKHLPREKEVITREREPIRKPASPVSEYSTEESSTVPPSRLVIDKNQRLVLEKPMKDAQVTRIEIEPQKVRREVVKREGVKREGVKREGVKREGAKREVVKREGVKREVVKRERRPPKTRKLREASISASDVESSTNMDKSSASLIRNWSNWMVNLTKKARSLVKWDGSGLDQYSTASGLQIADKNDDAAVEEKLKKIQEKAQKSKLNKKILQASLESDKTAEAKYQTKDYDKAKESDIKDLENGGRILTYFRSNK